MFVSIYWTLLADYGQIAPTTYPYVQSSVWQGYPNTSYLSPTLYPPTNNIFYNETLFESYSVYLNDTILPLFKSFYGLNITLPQFKSPLQPQPTTFVRTYFCTQKQLKGLASVVISVFAADYTLVLGVFGVAILMAKCWPWCNRADPETGKFNDA